MEIFPKVTNPGGNVTIKTSVILEPNATRNFVITVLPLEEPSHQYLLVLTADSYGFASETIYYPTNFSRASTLNVGNYTVYVQDAEKLTLIKSSSFVVTVFPIIPPEILAILDKFIFPATIAGIGAGLTILYNSLSKNREIATSRHQKRTEIFLSSSFYHWHVASYSKYLALELNKRPRDSLKCFHYLIRFLQSHELLFEKVGSYFLDDPSGEALVNAIEANIFNRLTTDFGSLKIDRFKKIITKNECVTDLDKKLNENEEAKSLFVDFTGWLNKEGLNELIFDLEFYCDAIDYEINKLFRNWYTKKKGINEKLQGLKEKIENILGTQRYMGFKIT